MTQQDDERLRLILDELQATREQMHRQHVTLMGEVAVLNLNARWIYWLIYSLRTIAVLLLGFTSVFIFFVSEIFFTHDPWLQNLLRSTGGFALLVTTMAFIIVHEYNELKVTKPPAPADTEPSASTPVNEMSGRQPFDGKSRDEGYALLMEKYRREAEAYRENRRVAAEMDENRKQVKKQQP